MSVNIERMLQDIQEFSTVVQDTIGRSIEGSFGYVTTPETNAFLMYTILVLLVLAVVRVLRTPGGQVKKKGLSRSSKGYDFNRYG